MMENLTNYLFFIFLNYFFYNIFLLFKSYDIFKYKKLFLE